jgi:hypothetical protein
MNVFHSVSNKALLDLAKAKSRQERALSLEVITLLREIDARRLYLGLGFGSLFDYVTKELGYEESAANRRIAACRLIREVPEVEEKIKAGKLSLSNIVQAQVFFRKEAKLQNKKPDRDEKKEVLTLLENKSAREAQKILLERSPEQARLKEYQRQVTPEHTEVKFVMSEDLRRKLEKLKLLLSHKNPTMNFAELIDELAKIALKKLDPARDALDKSHRPCGPRDATVKSSRPSGTGDASGKSRTQGIDKKTSLHGLSGEGNREPNDSNSQTMSFDLPPTSAVQNETDSFAARYIPRAVKRTVWNRDGGRCTFTHPLTKQRCQSRFQLEMHHVIPFAKGGQNSEKNLKLLCRKHNIHQAVHDFGLSKMRDFVPDLNERG